MPTSLVSTGVQFPNNTIQTTAANGTVTSVTISAGTGLSGGGTITSSGTISLTNAGVTSISAGTGITVSASTGSITISSSAGATQLPMVFTAF